MMPLTPESLIPIQDLVLPSGSLFGFIEPPYWDDAPVYLVGGGSSLYGFDFSRLEGKGHIVGINASMFHAPCECGVSVDHPFIRNRIESLREFAKNKPLYLCVGNEWRKNGLPEVKGATYLWSVPKAGLSTEPEYVHKGATSGYVALGIAALKRARKIILLGYDYKTIGGRHHYHNGYPWYHNASNQSWSIWARRYEPAAMDCLSLGIEVLNASPDSELPYWPKITLEDALNVSP